MNTNTFNYRVVFNLYASARLNITPKTGTLSLDDSGILTLTDTSDQEVIMRKPFTELAGVRPSQFIHFYKFASGSYGLILYVNRNEAYKIVFVPENPVANGGVDVYERLMQGDMTGGAQELKQIYSTPRDSATLSAGVRQANTYYANFIAAAKQANVYKSAFTSAPFIGGVILFVLAVSFFIYAFLKMSY